MKGSMNEGGIASKVLSLACHRYRKIYVSYRDKKDIFSAKYGPPVDLGYHRQQFVVDLFKLTFKFVLYLPDTHNKLINMVMNHYMVLLRRTVFKILIIILVYLLCTH